jgi:hypothetical protein
MRFVGLPRIEIADEVGKLVRPAMLVLLRRAGEARGVARELAQRDLADFALLQLGDVFGDGVVERDFALLDRLREQGGDEGLADGGEVEQRVRGDRRFARDVGHAVVEEQGAAVDRKRDRHAAGGNEHRLHVPAHQLLDFRIGLGACCGGGAECRESERCRHECSRAPHRVPPSTRRCDVCRQSIAPHLLACRNSTAPPPPAELIRVHINPRPCCFERSTSARSSARKRVARVVWPPVPSPLAGEGTIVWQTTRMGEGVFSCQHTPHP